MSFHTHTGNCPRCGAPVFAVTDKPPAGRTAGDENLGGRAFMDQPSVHFTCECRKALPAPLPDDEEITEESVDDADRKHLARSRPGPEAPSAERAE